jgi:hypothetical protein
MIGLPAIAFGPEERHLGGKRRPGYITCSSLCSRMQSSSSTRPFKSALSDARSDANTTFDCRVTQNSEYSPD